METKENQIFVNKLLVSNQSVKNLIQPFSANDYIEINRGDNNNIVSLSVESSIKFNKDSIGMKIIKCLILMTYISEVFLLKDNTFVNYIITNESYGTFDTQEINDKLNIIFTLNNTDKNNHVIVQLDVLLQDVFGKSECVKYKTYLSTIKLIADQIKNKGKDDTNKILESLENKEEWNKVFYNDMLLKLKSIKYNVEKDDLILPDEYKDCKGSSKLLFEKGYLLKIYNRNDEITGFSVKNTIKFAKDSIGMKIIKCLILMNCINSKIFYGSFENEKNKNDENEDIVFDFKNPNKKDYDYVIVQLDVLLQDVFGKSECVKYKTYLSTIKLIADQIKNKGKDDPNKILESLENKEECNKVFYSDMLGYLEKNTKYNTANNDLILPDGYDEKPEIKKDNTFRDSVIGIVLVSVIVGITYFFMTKEEFKNDDETENNENNIKRN